MLVLLIGCNTAAPTGSPTPSPTAGTIDHPTDPHSVVLRMESGGGFVPMEFFLTQAPDFTLYGDGTVIYRQTDTRASDPFGGQGMLPFLVGHLDEDGVQALLSFALGQGHLLNAKANYNNSHVADAGSTVFTLNAAGLSKTVSINALGMDADPSEAADRQAFQLLAQQLATFERRGANGELGEIKPYDPAFYRVYVIVAEQAVQPVLDWPWTDLSPQDFKVQDPSSRDYANLDRDHVSKIETVPTGGRTGQYVKIDGAVYLIGIRPLFPDDLAAAGLG